MIFTPQPNRPHGAFDGVGVDIDAAVAEEPDEPFPSRQGVANGDGERRFSRDRREPGLQPRLHRFDDRLGAGLAGALASLGALAANVALDVIERADAREHLGGDRRGRCRLDLEEATAHMRPTEGERDIAGFRQSLIGAVAVDLQQAFEAGKMSGWPFVLAVRRIDVSDAGRLGSAPRAIVAGVGPKLPDLGSSSTRIEHRRRRLVGEKPCRALQRFEQTLMHGAQLIGGAADPIGERRAIELDPLSRVNLRLSIERQMVGVFGDDDMGDERLGRNAALDQPLLRRRLGDLALAAPTSVFGTTGDDALETRRRHVEPLGHVLGDYMPQSLAAGAALVGNVDDDLFTGQMGGKRAAIDAALASRFLLLAGLLLLRFRGRRSQRLLDVLEHQGELIGVDLLRAGAEAVALQLLDDCGQAGDVLIRRRDLFGVLFPLRKKQSAQSARIGRKRVDEAHEAHGSTSEKACRARSFEMLRMSRFVALTARLSEPRRERRARASNRDLRAMRRVAPATYAARRPRSSAIESRFAPDAS